MKRSILTLAILTLPTLAACDEAPTAMIGQTCAVTPVGAQLIVEDWDLDGHPDTLPWVAARLKGECGKAALAQLQVAAYATSPSLTFGGLAKLVAYSPTCAVWQWTKTPKISGDWSVGVTPMQGGSVAALYSANVDGYTAGAALPVWDLGDGEGWAARLPYGVPTVTGDCQP